MTYRHALSWGLTTLLATTGCGDDSSSESSDGSSGSSSTTDTTDTTTTTTTATTTTDTTTSTTDPSSSTTDPTSTSTTDDSTGSTSGSTGGTGGSTGTTGGAMAEPQLVVVAAGRFLHLYDVAGGTLVEVDSAEIPAAGLLPIHQIFNIVQQPTVDALYVASSNDCAQGGGADNCWGNARIDRFTFTAASITYDSLAYEMNNAAFLADGITCAQGTEDDTGFSGQEGTCAPGGLVFSSDGSRFYVDDDDDDILEIFSVNGADGSLGFLAEGASTDVHGLAISTDDAYLYNGLQVLGVTGDVPTTIVSSSGGNGTTVVPGTPDRLVTAISTDSVGVYDLTNPEAPAEIDRLDLASTSGRGAFDIDFRDDLSRFVVGGQNEVRTLSFDGMTLVQEDIDVQMGLNGRNNRAVELVGENDEYAVVTYFRGGNRAPVSVGGVALYAIDEMTGALTELETVDLPAPARAVLQVSPR